MGKEISLELRTLALEQVARRLGQSGAASPQLQSAVAVQFADSVQRVVSGHADWMRQKQPLLMLLPSAAVSGLSPERQARIDAARAQRQKEAASLLSETAETLARNHQVRLRQFFTLIGISETLSDRLVTTLIADS